MTPFGTLHLVNITPDIKTGLTRAGLRAAMREGADAKGRHLIRPSPTRTTQGWSCLPLVSYLGNRGFLQDSKLRVARGVRAG